MQPPPRLADTHAERDYSPPQKRPVTVQKQLEGTDMLMSSADRVAHIGVTLSTVL